MARTPQRGASLWWAAAGLAVLAWVMWEAQPGVAPGFEPTGAGRGPAGASASAASASPSTSARPPFTEPALQWRARERQVEQQRLVLAQQTLDAYLRATRYPPGSQPLASRPDMNLPDRPVTEHHPLRMPGGKAAEGVYLRTTQERLFVLGDESVQLSVSLHGDDGRTRPLRIVRAVAREVTSPGTGSLYPVVPLRFNDEGVDGDATAGDGIFEARLQPSAQGYDGLLGQVRVEVIVQHRNDKGFAYFDVMLTPQPPAVWAGAVREAVEGGSLVFRLGADVREAGRYVVTARVDDAAGRPFALLTFNDEVAAGPQEFRLEVFGRLLHDVRPAFPLTLRDVEAFLLRPDVFPDRLLMPRRAGNVHVSREHAPGAFSDAEWQSEERERYVAELRRDVSEAQSRLERLGQPP
jgi:hypothetical protein